MRIHQISNKGSVLQVFLTILMFSLFFLPMEARSSCANPGNVIEAENCLPGAPPAQWDIPSKDAGDPSIQGFATNISVNRGDTVNFKVNTPANAWRLDIYRMGYYGGNGARLVGSVNPSVPLPQNQPACLSDASTGLIDCGNWAVSASWAVPAGATSGIYFAKAIRTDTGGSSHIFFIVRDDASFSDILFQVSDATWQAYNDWGGRSLYGCGNLDLNCRARKVSYNRPFDTRFFETESWVFNAEYPMVRWLEANGYDVTYSTNIDAERNGALITNHKIWMSNGHDEYWSAGQRTSVENARAAGVNLTFFSSNTMFWKTRWESSIDGSGTPYRTLVCYKETHDNSPSDPADPPTWTGTWRDPRFSPPADGGRPENALLGTIYMLNGPISEAIAVPQADGKMRFWRNTSVANLASGQTAILAPGTLGAEVAVDLDNGFRPPGLFGLSANVITTGDKYLLDHGSTYGAGTGTHKLSLYRHTSGALVFAAGTYQWSWGLDANHDRGNLGSTTDMRMQQATVNLFADMEVQPVSLQTGLSQATVSTDVTAPSSAITSPVSGANLAAGSSVTISGTAADSGGGVVGAVEVSTDSGASWRLAAGREVWSYTWLPTGTGNRTIYSRAVDDSGNLGAASPAVVVTISTATSATSLWSPAIIPTVVDPGPDSAVELGVKFRSDVGGFITGVRFYKASANTGTHVGNLWSSSGTRLATATFSNETASGWQQVNFAVPVAISANTVYVASYHTTVGHYSVNQNYFTGQGMDSPPLHALASGVSGVNGVYAYGASSSFPTLGWNNTNYWVDVVFNATPPPPVTLSSITVTPASPTISAGASQQFTATGTYSDGSTQNLSSQASWASSAPGVASITSSGLASGLGAGSSTISATLNGMVGSTSLTVQVLPLTITTASVPNGTLNAPYTTSLTASGGVAPRAWSLSAGALPTGLTLNPGTGVISGLPTVSGTFNFTVRAVDSSIPQQTATKALSLTVSAQASLTIWPASTVPAVVDPGPDSAVELGVKFRSDVGGFITGVRFYKASANTGTHIGNLWSSSGTRLATATFSNETASGWQQVNFAAPVAISANTVYVASYHASAGHYSVNQNYFTGQGMDSPPLHALASGVSGVNGVYAYGASSSFPTQGWNNTNYWVDVVFNATPPPPVTLSSITVTPAGQTIATGASQQFTATGTYSNGSTQNLTSQATWVSSTPGVASITSTGLATGLSTGSSTLSATLSGVVGSTNLTVQVLPLTITTASLPGGVLNVSYSTTLASIGGTAPTTWSISSGALPTGLTLNPGTGVISGLPTASGTFNVTVRAVDSGTPQQSATKALSLAVSAQTSFTLWPASATPNEVDGGPDSAVELGVKFRSDVSGYITGIRFYKASANTGTHVGSLWSSSGTRLATATFSNETASGWQQVNFAAPVAISANTVYVASYHASVGHYSVNQNYFTGQGMDSPPLHALASGVSGVNGVYAYGASSSFPTQGWNNTNYWVDVVFRQ